MRDTRAREGQRKSDLHFPEISISPESRPSKKETSLPTIHFQVRAVSFREGKLVRFF